MRTRLLIILLALLFITSPAIGNDASKYVIGEDDKLIVTTEGGIPDYTEQDETVNGRPQNLDTDNRTAEELNSVERRIIMRDTIITNRQGLQNLGGQ